MDTWISRVSASGIQKAKRLQIQVFVFVHIVQVARRAFSHGVACVLENLICFGQIKREGVVRICKT